MRVIVSILVLLVAVQMCKAQGEGVNPFELLHRMDLEQILVKKDSSSNKTIFVPKSDNPFEVYTKEVKTFAEVDKEENAPVSIVPASVVKAPTQPKNRFNAGFLFWLMIGVLFFLAIIATLYRSYLQKIFEAGLNENILNSMYREHGGVALVPYMATYLVYILVGGVFISLLIRHFAGASLVYSQGWLFLMSSGALLLLLFMKHTVLRFIAIVFPVNKEMGLYSFMIGIFNQIIGLILLPLTMIAAFSSDAISVPTIYLALCILGLCLLFRSFRGLLIGNKFLFGNKFHFFIYLCVVEISPVIVLFKMIVLANKV